MLTHTIRLDHALSLGTTVHWIGNILIYMHMGLVIKTDCFGKKFHLSTKGDVYKSVIDIPWEVAFLLAWFFAPSLLSICRP